ncbi:hypothetical protein GmHk_11G032836 [Glycine max]|nr:hypothetical protein GmHk_11G032836 [Glycine max]
MVNLPLPQPAAHPFTPLLQIPEDPTTHILAMDISPPTTPILQLTNEEDDSRRAYGSRRIYSKFGGGKLKRMKRKRLNRQLWQSAIFHAFTKPAAGLARIR